MRKLLVAGVALGGIVGGRLLKARLGGSGRASDKRNPWQRNESTELHAVELPATAEARNQHEQPMRASEERVDPAHTSHGR